MQKINLILSLILVTLFFSCSKKQVVLFPADSGNIRYQGRIDFTSQKEPVLIGSAAFVEVHFSGDSCSVLLQKQNPAGEYNFVSVELDGEYIGRVKLEKEGMQSYTVWVDPVKENHVLRIFKSTEAGNNSIVFGGVRCFNILQLPALPQRKIEFIGNSITCGMGIDWQEIPCHTGVWYDQHNAYFAYGPQSAMSLDAQFMLSSVSGIGIYRNWNSPGPSMPEVYENKYLNTDNSKKWDFTSYVPDLVSICLGTNDFSDGDGSYDRLPFDSVQYVNNYISFLKTIYSHYPETQVCLLTSPMVSGEKALKFERCLIAVKNYFDETEPDKRKIATYFFKDLPPHGCDSHPDKDDHKNMAELLVPFYKEVMGW
ncbi:MAG TPA: GDSL-type esterase/lipase family protein [Draconibacterium sp.]|nr:GDSL-type esterase/lipase family protein [Draconibacterium sp.]